MRGIFFFHAEDGIRDRDVTGVQTCALPISGGGARPRRRRPLAMRCEGGWTGWRWWGSPPFGCLLVGVKDAQRDDLARRRVGLLLVGRFQRGGGLGRWWGGPGARAGCSGAGRDLAVLARGRGAWLVGGAAAGG